MKWKQVNFDRRVIIECRGGGIQDNIRKARRAACKAAGITYRVCLYSIRRLYVTYGTSQGCDIGGLRKIAGIHPPGMVMLHYDHITAASQRRVADLVPDLRRKDESGKVIQISKAKFGESSEKSSNEKRGWKRSSNPLIFLWSYGESNPGPLECHSSALPTELQPRLRRTAEVIFPTRSTIMFSTQFMRNCQDPFESRSYSPLDSRLDPQESPGTVAFLLTPEAAPD